MENAESDALLSKSKARYDPSTDDVPLDIVGDSSVFRQFSALFIKQAILQVRHKWQNLFIIGVPVIMIAFTGILQLVVNNVMPVVPPTPVTGYPIPFNFFDVAPLNVPTSDRHFYQAYYYTTEDDQQMLDIIGFRNSSGSSSGMLSQISTLEYLPHPNHTTPHIRVPFFTYFNATTEMDAELLKSLNYLSASASGDTFKKNDTYLYKLPDGCKSNLHLMLIYMIVISFKSITNSSIEYVATTNTNEFFQRAIFFSPQVTMAISRARMISNIDAAYVRQFTKKKVRIVTLAQPLPFMYQSENFDVMLVVGIALFPSAISFLMPVFLQSLVMEKEKKLREMMKMMGMSSTIYWLVNYIVSVVNTLFSHIIV
jgi:hypothetical protein